jgi:Thioredoxin-like domain
MIFSVDETERKLLASTLAPVAMTFRGQANFATVDAQSHAFLLEPLGLSGDQLPAFVLQTSDEIYHFNPNTTINSAAVDKFIKQALNLGPIQTSAVAEKDEL